MKKIIAALLIIFTLILSLVSCNTTGDYTITIVDGLGNPMANVIVKIETPDGESITRVSGKDGIVSLKEVTLGNYKIILEKGFSDAIITESEYLLTKKITSLNIILRDESKSTDIYGSVPDGSFATFVGVGEYTIPCKESNKNYYVFTAITTGIYKFSVTNGMGAMIGYYGGPMFVQPDHLQEGEYDGKSFELIVQDTSTPYVIGVFSTVSENVGFKIERISDAPFDPEYAPWDSVNKSQSIESCVIPEGTTLNDFDITDSSISVVERDGFYYTADGKPVYIRIKSSSETYLPGASLAYLAGYVDNNIGGNIGGYVYDDNGNFVAKLSYNLMIKDYMEYCDSTYGVVPLTAELAECIKLHGKQNGWWTKGSMNYLFGDQDIVQENAWLFLCMI